MSDLKAKQKKFSLNLVVNSLTLKMSNKVFKEQFCDRTKPFKARQKHQFRVQISILL